MKLPERVAWHLNARFGRRLSWLARLRARVSLVSQFRTPGDTLLTGTVGDILKRRWPGLRLNALVAQPDLLEGHPAFAEIGGPPGVWRLTFDYLRIIDGREAETNLLGPFLASVGIEDFEYRTRLFLTAGERATAARRLPPDNRPTLTFNSQSRESTKTWPLAHWRALVADLAGDFRLVQLGDETEPAFPEAISFAGKLNRRESVAVLSHARIHVGPVSFLMHAASGVDVPSVIIYGGRETPANSGYATNTNLFTPMPCGPCWIHDERGERCAHGLACLTAITPAQVAAAVRAKLAAVAEPVTR